MLIKESLYEHWPPTSRSDDPDPASFKDDHTQAPFMAAVIVATRTQHRDGVTGGLQFKLCQELQEVEAGIAMAVAASGGQRHTGPAPRAGELCRPAVPLDRRFAMLPSTSQMGTPRLSVSDRTLTVPPPWSGPRPFLASAEMRASVWRGAAWQPVA